MDTVKPITDNGYCFYCKSKNIKREVPYGNFVTLKTDTFNNQQTYADVCMDCGTVIRNYVEVQRLHKVMK